MHRCGDAQHAQSAAHAAHMAACRPLEACLLPALKQAFHSELVMGERERDRERGGGGANAGVRQCAKHCCVCQSLGQHSMQTRAETRRPSVRELACWARLSRPLGWLGAGDRGLSPLAGVPHGGQLAHTLVMHHTLVLWRQMPPVCSIQPGQQVLGPGAVHVDVHGALPLSLPPRGVLQGGASRRCALLSLGSFSSLACIHALPHLLFPILLMRLLLLLLLMMMVGLMMLMLMLRALLLGARLAGALCRRLS